MARVFDAMSLGTYAPVKAKDLGTNENADEDRTLRDFGLVHREGGRTLDSLLHASAAW